MNDQEPQKILLIGDSISIGYEPHVRQMFDGQLQVAHNNPAAQAFWRAMGCTDLLNTLWYNLEVK